MNLCYWSDLNIIISMFLSISGVKTSYHVISKLLMHYLTALLVLFTYGFIQLERSEVATSNFQMGKILVISCLKVLHFFLFT